MKLLSAHVLIQKPKDDDNVKDDDDFDIEIHRNCPLLQPENLRKRKLNDNETKPKMSQMFTES